MNIQTTQITLSMKEHIERIRKENAHITASHAFASLYIWRKEMGLSIYLEEELFAVKSLWRGKNAWFFPCGSREAVKDFIGRSLGEEDLLFCYMRKEDIAFLNREFPGRFRITERKCDHEYLYDRKEQKELKGKGFAASRKYIHRLQSGCELAWQPVNESNLADAMSVIREWKGHSEGVDGLMDKTASAVLMQHWEKLDASGILVRINGEPKSVMAGYPIGKRMFDISLAKQNCFADGLAEYTRYAFFLFLPEEYTLANGEEDLGIEGLRLTKQRMRPVGQIQMYEGRENVIGKKG